MHTATHTVAAVSLLALCQAAAATDLLIVTPQHDPIGYGYGRPLWESFSEQIDRAVARSRGRVSTTTEIPTSARNFDALMVDQRWTDGQLSQAEIGQLKAFIATGKRVLLIGENSNWEPWNGQLLDPLGGRFDTDVSGQLSRVLAHPLTRNLPFIQVYGAGTAVGGTALFDRNFATLWGQQHSILTVLDVNVFDEEHGYQAFRHNVASWLASPVPEPNGVALMLAGLGVLGFVACRRHP